jgi:S-DNA-T family DNA segregation ATPase FtsK/SpoIIIE
MACRISFSLPSSRDSQVILDEPGAERLLRNGDMLLIVEGGLTRLQGYYIEPAQIEAYLENLG